MVARYLIALTAAACFTVSAFAAEDSPDWNATTLTGDWGGMRTNLANKGMSLELTHKSDFLSNTSGGIKRGSAWMGHTEAVANLDLEKLAGWNGTSALVHFHSQLGSKFARDYVGSLGVDNIETPSNTAQFYQAWLQKNSADNSLSLLGGLYAIDTEFYVTDTSGLFIQPPYGMANEVALSGQAGPPIYPVGALALRLKYTSPDNNFYAQYALADGVPGDPTTPLPRGTHIQLNKGDGSLSMVEFGLTPQPAKTETAPQEEIEYFNKTAIGFWRYTTQLADLAGSPAFYPSQGIYFLAERSLTVEKDHPAQGLSGFARFGTASKDVTQTDWTGSIGLRYHGLIEGRDDDIAGIAITVNHASDKFRSFGLTPLIAESTETDVEVTYRAQINPWFALQPTLQFISNPSMDPTLGNAWIIGARAEISF